MQPHGPNDQTGPGPAGDSPVDASARAGPPLPAGAPRGHAWIWATVAGVLAGLLSWSCQEKLYGHFKPEFQLPPNYAKLSPYDKTDVLSNLTRMATPAAELRNAAVAYGMLGAALAAALGLAGGVVRRSPGAAMVAAIVGIVAGAAAGAGMSVVMTDYFYKHIEPESGMTLALLTHGGIWVPIGAAAGLAFGIGLGGFRSIALGLFGAVAGAIFGTMLFEVANAILFPLVRVFEPVPAGKSSRLLAFLCVALFVALGAAIGVQRRAPRKVTTPETA